MDVMRTLSASGGELAGGFPPFIHLSVSHIPAQEKHRKKP